MDQLEPPSQSGAMNPTGRDLPLEREEQPDVGFVDVGGNQIQPLDLTRDLGQVAPVVNPMTLPGTDQPGRTENSPEPGHFLMVEVLDNVKQEPPEEVQSCPEAESMDQDSSGVAQISQSSYSASINLAHKASRMKEEDAAMETSTDFGFSMVDVNCVQCSEPEVDPLELSPPIKDEPPLGLRETLFVDVKREPESQGLPGDQELSPWNADESLFEPDVSIEESEDMVTATDVMSRVNPEGQDSAVSSEEGPSGLGRSSREVDSTSCLTSRMGAERSKHDIQEDSVMDKQNEQTREKPFACDTCKSRFAQKSHLTTHMRTHTGLKPYACEICKTKFAQTSHLRTHMRTHTGVKPYACEVCKVMFSDKGNLKNHMVTHSGVKPYVCDICEASFYRKAGLNIHLRTHFKSLIPGEKPHICGTCQARFYAKSDLTRHLRTHTVVEPHFCDLCERKFSRKDNLNSHKRRHHGTPP